MKKTREEDFDVPIVVVMLLTFEKFASLLVHLFLSK